MEDISESVILKEEIDKLLGSFQPVTSVNKRLVRREELKEVGPVLGKLGLAGSPHYSIILETGSTQEPYILPLTVTNVAKDLSQWVLVIGKVVLIHKLLVIIEQITNGVTNTEINKINLLIRWEDVSVFGQECSVQLTNFPNNVDQLFSLQPEHTDKCSDTTKAHINSLKKEMCHIMVHHISSPFYDNHPPANCLVLISYADQRNLVSKLWLILKSEQVSWREFIMPNREYFIDFPVGINKYFFDRNKKPLREIFLDPSRELRAILHHETYFYSLHGSEIPAGSKMFLTNNTQLSKYNLQFKDDPLRHWYSINEVDNAASNLITLYGKVDGVMYDNQDYSSKFCSLCTHAHPKGLAVLKPKCMDINSWTNPWESQLTDENVEFIELPTACDISNKIMQTGVPGNSVQILKIRDVVTDDVRTIYVKHSDSPNVQQLCGLAPGILIVYSHLNRRQSSSGMYYYTPTVLSGFKILLSVQPAQESESWGQYGLVDCRNKTWGVIETNSLSKVAITTKCSKCGAQVSYGACSSHCSPPYAFITSAHAIGWILVFNGSKATQEKVLIKDNNVRKLLCIPDGIWQTLLKAAVEQEIVCFPNDQNVSETRGDTHISELLKIYCSVANTNSKFYVSVKKMNSVGEALFYCINLEPVNKDRLNIVAKTVKETLLK